MKTNDLARLAQIGDNYFILLEIQCEKEHFAIDISLSTQLSSWNITIRTINHLVSVKLLFISVPFAFDAAIQIRLYVTCFLTSVFHIISAMLLDVHHCFGWLALVPYGSAKCMCMLQHLGEIGGNKIRRGYLSAKLAHKMADKIVTCNFFDNNCYSWCLDVEDIWPHV